MPLRIFLLLAIFQNGLCAESVSGSSTERPHIIFILADDAVSNIKL